MRLEVRVFAAMVSTRAPEYPSAANSSVATSMMSRLVRSGSFLRFSPRVFLGFFGLGVMSVRCSMLPLLLPANDIGHSRHGKFALARNEPVRTLLGRRRQAATGPLLFGKAGPRKSGGKNSHKNDQKDRRSKDQHRGKHEFLDTGQGPPAAPRRPRLLRRQHARILRLLHLWHRGRADLSAGVLRQCRSGHRNVARALKLR